jgi:hypothetical protein
MPLTNVPLTRKIQLLLLLLLLCSVPGESTPGTLWIGGLGGPQSRSGGYGAEEMFCNCRTFNWARHPRMSPAVLTEVTRLLSLLLLVYSAAGV